MIRKIFNSLGVGNRGCIVLPGPKHNRPTLGFHIEG